MIAEPICFALTRLARKLRGRRDTHPERTQSNESYFLWQHETSPQHFNRFMRGLDLGGKDVLDLGCGMGGRSCFYASKNPRTVTGVDINTAEVAIAEDLARKHFPEFQDRLRFLVSPDGSIPLAPSTIDAVILVDTFEHLARPEDILAECARVLRPGGLLWFGTIGWYNYNASHILTYIPIPWCQVLFSDRTLIDTIIRVTQLPDYEETVWDRENRIRERWQQAKDLTERPGEYLNKITLRRIRDIIRNAPDYTLRDFTLHGFGGSQLKAMKLLNGLTRLPYLDELFHSYVSVTLTRV